MPSYSLELGFEATLNMASLVQEVIHVVWERKVQLRVIPCL